MIKTDTISSPLSTIVMGFVFALLLNTPSFAMVFERDWPWAYSMPITLLANGFEYFITFFHEMGHTIAAWFYGAPTIPMFDFAHGGGWAWPPVGQIIPLLVIFWGIAIYGVFTLRDWLWLQIAIVILLIFNVATAFNDWHSNVIDFMGPGAEAITGAIFLTRALFDLAPRGGGERFMNALFGFAMPIHSLIMGWGLLHNAEVRHMYWTQKDAQGSGDFDKIADRILTGDFHSIVNVWMGLSVLCLLIPFIFYAWNRIRAL